MPITQLRAGFTPLPSVEQSNPWLQSTKDLQAIQAQGIANQYQPQLLQAQLQQRQLANQKAQELMKYVDPQAQATLKATQAKTPLEEAQARLTSQQAQYYPDIASAREASARNAAMTPIQKAAEYYKNTTPGTLEHAYAAYGLRQAIQGKQGLNIQMPGGPTISTGGTPIGIGAGPLSSLVPTGLPETQQNQPTTVGVPGTYGRGQRGMMTVTTNPDGTLTYRQSPTMATESQQQKRAMASSEGSVLEDAVLQGASPYQKAYGMGNFSLEDDISAAKKGDKNARQRVVNYEAARQLMMDNALNRLRMAGNPNPAQKAIEEQVSKMYPNMPFDITQLSLPADITRDATIKAGSVLRRGVGAAGQTMVTQFPQTVGSPSQAPSSGDRITVVNKDGVRGTIPKSQLNQALKAGYKEVS